MATRSASRNNDGKAIQLRAKNVTNPVRLTQMAKRAGCAAKQPPGYLLPLLKSLPAITDPNVLVGSATADDSAIYKLSNDLALVLTTDFFTPIVDAPYDFGAVAAANELDAYSQALTNSTNTSFDEVRNSEFRGYQPAIFGLVSELKGRRPCDHFEISLAREAIYEFLCQAIGKKSPIVLFGHIDERQHRN